MLVTPCHASPVFKEGVKKDEPARIVPADVLLGGARMRPADEDYWQGCLWCLDAPRPGDGHEQEYTRINWVLPVLGFILLILVILPMLLMVP